MRAAIRVVVLGVASLAVFSCGSGPSSEGGKAKPKLAERRTQTFDFGKARQDTVLHHTFTVKNDGTAPVKVARVQTTCGCTVATVKKDAIVEPGAALDVPVDLNLRGKHNPVESKVIVNYAEGAIPDELILKGTVAEEYPGVVTLPKTKRGEQPEQVVTLSTYPGQPPLAVEEITFDPAKFEVTHTPGAQEGTVDVVIKAAANAPYGAVMDQVVVKTNDIEVPDKPIAARVHVLKPLEATTPRLVLHPGNEGEPITGVAEFASTYGEPITDVTVSVSREKRFTAIVEPDAPADMVRVRVTVNPPEKKKKPFIESTLKVSAKVGGNDVDEKMNLIYAIAADGPGESDEMTADSEEPGNDTGRR